MIKLYMSLHYLIFLFGVLVSLAVASTQPEVLSGVISSNSPDPPGPTLECSIVILGNASINTPESWSVTYASIKCKRFSKFNEDAVALGPLLDSLIQQQTTPPDDSCNDENLAFACFAYQGTRPFAESEDAGVTFQDVVHLRLVDSVIRGIRLPVRIPLLICRGCQYVSFSNFTAEHLFGLLPNDDPNEQERPGVVYIELGYPKWSSGLQRYAQRQVVLETFSCSNVSGASGFACFQVDITAIPIEDEDQPPPAVTVEMTSSSFEGNSVVGENFLSQYPDIYDPVGYGAVLVSAASHNGRDPITVSVTVSNTSFKDNYGGYGAGLAFSCVYSGESCWLRVDTMNLTGSKMIGNIARRNGGAVLFGPFVDSVDQLVITDSDIYNNSADANGGAIFVSLDAGTLLIHAKSNILDNVAGRGDFTLTSGGAIHITRHLSSFYLLGTSNVSHNRAGTWGGALYVDGDLGLVHIDGNSRLDHNVACLGGAICVKNGDVSSVTVRGQSTISNNYASSPTAESLQFDEFGGGALYIGLNLGKLVVEDSSCICSNYADSFGGAVYVKGSVLQSVAVLQDSNISDNQARGISQYVSGGGLCVQGRLESLTIANSSSISRNAVNRSSGGEGWCQGGAIWVRAGLGRLTVSNRSSLSSNFAVHGGSAIHISEGDMDFSLISGSSCICNNTAGLTGFGSGAFFGAISLQAGRVHHFEACERSCICSNRAPYGDGFGGALYASYGIGTFALRDQSSLSYNMGGQGGAIYARHGEHSMALSNFSCDTCIIHGNFARASGGALYMIGGVEHFSLVNSTVSNNVANNEAGAIHMVGMFGRFQVQDSLVYDNHAGFSYGGFLALVADTLDARLIRTTYPEGPFFLNIRNSNISSNTALKDGGAIYVSLAVGVPTITSNTDRDLARVRLFTYITIHGSHLDSNVADQGAGGAIAFIGMVAAVATGANTRLFSVNMGSRTEIVDSSFTNNKAGRAEFTLSYIQDVSPRQGNGGGIFYWARPYLVVPTEVERQNVLYDFDAFRGLNALPRDARMVSCNIAAGGQHPGGGYYEVLPSPECSKFTWPSSSESCQLYLKNVTFDGNNAASGFGGGAFFGSCALRAYGSLFTKNVAQRNGGGLAFMDSSTFKVLSEDMVASSLKGSDNSTSTVSPLSSQAPNSDETFTKARDYVRSLSRFSHVNTSVAELFLFGEAQPAMLPWLIIQGTVFDQNTASMAGAGLYAEVNYTAAIITACKLTGNQAATEGGGMFMVVSSTLPRLPVLITDSTLGGNYAGVFGGGLSLRLENVRTARTAIALVDVSVKDNLAANGGGLFSAGGKGAAMLLSWGCKFKNNTALSSGGAVAIEFVSSISRHADTVGSTTGGGVSHSQSFSGNGTSSLLYLLACHISGNQAGSTGGGAAIKVDPSVWAAIEQSNVELSQAVLAGGGVYFDGAQRGRLQIIDCTFSINTAWGQHGRGGGIAAFSGCGGQVLVSNGSVLVGNKAHMYGGAIFVADAEESRVTRNETSQCSHPGFILANATVRDNEAYEGGGVYVGINTVISISSTAIQRNEAGMSGGSVAAVNCSLLYMMGCSVSQSKAGLSGGGIFADKCMRILLKDTELMNNTASTGGAVHFAGFNGTGSNSSLHRRQMATAHSSALQSYATAALLNRIILSKNTATGSYTEQAQPASSSPELAAILEGYGGHGGGFFIHGDIGVAVTDSFVAGDNSADVGSFVATTQVCKHASFSKQTRLAANRSPVAMEEVINSHSAVEALSALSEASDLGCSLLIIRETKLPSLSQLETPFVQQHQQDPEVLDASEGGASNSSLKPLPLLWLQDLAASSLQANCSWSLSLKEQQLTPFDEQAYTYHEASVAELVRASSSTPPANVVIGPLNTDSIFHGLGQQPQSVAVHSQQDMGDHNLLLRLRAMLEACTYKPEGVDVNTFNSPITLAVPATHMRLLKASGAVLLTRSSLNANHTGYWQHVTGPQQQSESNGGLIMSSAALTENEIAALAVTPGAPISLDIQLYDGLGQPVLVDLPAFKISLTLQPDDSMSMYNDRISAFDEVAVLRDSNFTVKAAAVVTRYGVASWNGLQVVGWPGRYNLHVTANPLGPGNNSYSNKVAGLIISVDLLPCELGQELVVEDEDREGAMPTRASCRQCRRDQVGLWIDNRIQLPDVRNISSMQSEIRQLAVDPTSSRCLNCPSSAACPGGAILVPRAGYWHSSPGSPLMHRCPHPAACGRADLDKLGGTWNELDRDFNLASHTAFVALEAIPGSTVSPVMSAVSGNQNVTISVTLDHPGIYLQLRGDQRAILLAKCQQWWYTNVPSQKDTALRNLYSVQHQPEGRPPCILLSNYSYVVDGRVTYMQLQCAKGYSGNLCATCQPSYTLTTDFECIRCPPIAQTIAIGGLAFIGTVALILFTTFSNFSDAQANAMQSEELSTMDILKTLITHLQYFIIITKLGIDYPSIIMKYQSALSAITGTESYIAYSPACLFEGLSSADQAAIQVLFGLLGPCTATFTTLLLWILRYLVSNHSRLQRLKGSRWAPTVASIPAAEPEDIADFNLSPDAKSVLAFSAGPSPTSESSVPANNLLSTTPSQVYRQAEITPHASLDPSDTVVSITRPPFATSPSAICEGKESEEAAKIVNIVASSIQQPSLPYVASSHHAVAAPEITLILDAPESPAHTETAVPEATAVKLYFEQLAKVAPTSPTSGRHQGLALYDEESAHPEDEDAPPPDELKDAESIGNWFRQWIMSINPRQILMHADQAIPLPNQLVIVIIVASFILYPSLCQVSLSIFACYKIDNGSGEYPQNQKATWSRGYWVRNMQQECYSGAHNNLYIPIGITSVILFCLCPPVVYFILTSRSRQRLKHASVRLKYGFLYQQYKPRFYWWASVRQFQTLALVAVEVFGRALTVLQQALMLLAILILIAAMNTACSPDRFHELMILEFLSTCVLSLTITLGLYFVGTGGDDAISGAASDVIGILILSINALFVLGFMIFMAKRHAESVRKVKRMLTASLGTMVSSVSKAIARIEQRYSSATGPQQQHSTESLVMQSSPKQQPYQQPAQQHQLQHHQQGP